MNLQVQTSKIDWQEVELGNKDYFEILSSGINDFEGKKDYLSTESIQGTNIEKIECEMTYQNRPSRANMQPVLNSIWFAKMQATLKVYCFDETNKNEIMKYILSTGFAGIKVNDKLVYPKYVKLFFISNIFNEEKDKLCTGSTQRGINNNFIARIKIPLPSLQVQKQIVSILENARALKQKREESDKSTKNYLQSVFYEMFDNCLKDKNKFKKITEFITEDRNSIKAGPFGSSLKKECYVKRGYKIYGQEQVIKDDLNFGDYYISKEKYKELENYKIQEGDLLISLVGTYGKISLVPKSFQEGIINPRLMKITLNKKKMNPTFFKFLFNLPIIKTELENISHGGTMDILNVGIIKKIDFPLPSIELQQKFASIVEQVEKLKEKQKQSKEQIDEIFNSLMRKAFKGELVK